MDIKDIMGIKTDGKGSVPKKPKTVTEKKPDGVSREVWQIMKGQTGSHDVLAPVVPTHAGLKDKRKVITSRKIAWSWQPFKNSARSDTLMLKHWVKTGASGSILPGSNGGDVGGDAGGGDAGDDHAVATTAAVIRLTGLYRRPKGAGSIKPAPNARGLFRVCLLDTPDAADDLTR